MIFDCQSSIKRFQRCFVGFQFLGISNPRSASFFSACSLSFSASAMILSQSWSKVPLKDLAVTIVVVYLTSIVRASRESPIVDFFLGSPSTVNPPHSMTIALEPRFVVTSLRVMNSPSVSCSPEFSISVNTSTTETAEVSSLALVPSSLLKRM